MADRTSCAIFAEFLSMLAENPTEEHKQMAESVYSSSQDYDFHPRDMGIDNELIVLGLAKKKPLDPDFPEDGEVVVCKGWSDSED